MQQFYQADYFDGVQSGKQLVALYFDERGISIQQNELWQADRLVLFFLYEDCTLQFVQNRMHVFLNKGATQYIVVPFDAPYFPALKANIEQATANWFSRLFKLKASVLVVIMLSLLATIYFGLTNFIPWVGLRIISAQQETYMGNKMFTAITNGETIDRRKTAIIKDFAAQLQLSKNYPINVTVLRSNEMNAFALPGGNIVVYSGLLRKMKSSDELAALLGHEASHINQRHSLKSILRSAATGIVVSIVLNDVSGVASVLVENAEMLRTLNYSRGVEQEADDEGMKLLVANGINPLAMKKLMQRFKEADVDIPEAIAFLSTHPTTDKRIKHAVEFGSTYKNSSFAPKPVLDSLWQKIKP